MFEYNICTCADQEIYTKQCNAIRRKFPDYTCKTIDDVDGSEISEFTKEKEKIKVYNDLYIGAVYIQSSFDLKPYFN